MNIWQAALEGNLNAVEAALSVGAEVTARDARGTLPTACAIQGRNAAVLRRLLDAGADVNATARIEPARDARAVYENDPLIVVAARVGDPEIVRVLLTAGADPSQRNSQASGGRVPKAWPHTTTALLNAASGAHSDVVRLLVEAGADIDDGRGPSEEFTGQSPLFEAIAQYALAVSHGRSNLNPSRYYETVRVLLDLGADPNRAREDGLLPILLAAGIYESTHTDKVHSLLALLLDAGASPVPAVAGLRYEGWTPLFVALLGLLLDDSGGNESDVQLLLAHGADPDQPLTHEVHMGYTKNAAFGTCVIPAGTTATEFARQHGHSLR